MDTDTAIARLSALAQESRLEVFRLLVQAGPNGLAAGDIARTIGIAPNTLSTHLTILAQSGLVRARRDGRARIYAAQYDAIRTLLAFLMEDCCQGRPEVCAPLMDIVAARCSPERSCS
jgi:DNA-binding transcriptional ArsR family regulator